MADQDVEGVVYTDHSGDEQRQNQQQQQALDLNATANETTGSGNINADSEGTQNGQPPPRDPIQGNRQSAFDRIGPSDGVGSSGIKKGERRISIQHKEPSAPGPDPAQAAFPIPVSFPTQKEPTTQIPPQAKRTQQPHTPGGGDDTTAARATVTPPREGIATHDGGPTSDTKEPEIGLLPRPLTATLHSQVGF
ncbi:hypothetical protein PIB30_037442 [Stylosanthes scabra]|uniref:Uncharacterized protein n=1 Tax=Stylosanthes scabra TaxID=79078 RepID=A0ABU6SDZ8_9FABA|nr:hypothetical protein [Stylosanthes scabra]